MITPKQIELLKLIYKKGEITTAQGLGIYQTYKGFYFSVNNLEAEGVVKRSKLLGTWFYSLSNKGKKIVRRLDNGG